MNDIFKFDEIPAGVIKEIEDNFQTVSYENYGGPLTPEIEARRANYYRFIAEGVEGVVADPETFEPKKIIGTQSEAYLVRGIFTDDKADIYAVQSAGIVVSNFRG